MRKLALVVVAVAVSIGAATALFVYERDQIFDVPARSTAQRADAGDPEAQVRLGVDYNGGLGVPKDDAKAIELFRKAAEQGNAAGKFHLGESFETGRGASKDLSRAVEWYRQAAKQESPEARGALRRLYIEGKIFPQMDAQADDWWQKFAEQADNESKAFEGLRLKAEGGDADAQTDLGLAYLTGFSTLKDRGKATEWFGKAAEQRNLRAQCLYEALEASDSGWGRRSNGRQAAEACKSAAAAGNAEAQRILGVLYATGRGLQKDLVESAAWTRKAAEQGNADAQWYLGFMYGKGEGVPKDKAEACAWNEKAAEQNYPYALESAALDAAFAFAKPSGDRCPDNGTADTKALWSLSIEYSPEKERELFPALLNRQAGCSGTSCEKSPLFDPYWPGLVLLTFSVALGISATWAWGWQGAAVGIASAPFAGLCISLITALLKRPESMPLSRLKFSTVFKFAVTVGTTWVAWVILGIVIGLAIRAIGGSQDSISKYSRRYRGLTAILTGVAATIIIAGGWVSLFDVPPASDPGLGLLISPILGLCTLVLVYSTLRKSQLVGRISEA